jgi:hypothetical protein
LAAVRWVAIKYRWALTIDTTEQRQLTRLLARTCGNTKTRLPSHGR